MPIPSLNLWKHCPEIENAPSGFPAFARLDQSPSNCISDDDIFNRAKHLVIQKIQGIEADRLGDPFKVYTSLELIGGIHIDRNSGAPTAYDIYNRSIGDFYTYQLTIPASQAFHLFDPLRIDQYRGISASRSCAAPTNSCNKMKTIDTPILQADPVISEVRRVKTALAVKHNFDVVAMVQSLQERERKQKGEQADGPNTCLRPPR